MPSRAATQDAMAHISTRAFSKVRNLDRSTIVAAQWLVETMEKGLGCWPLVRPASWIRAISCGPASGPRRSARRPGHHDHLDWSLAQRRLVLEHAGVAHLVDLETVLELDDEADRLAGGVAGVLAGREILEDHLGRMLGMDHGDLHAGEGLD